MVKSWRFLNVYLLLNFLYTNKLIIVTIIARIDAPKTDPTTKIVPRLSFCVLLGPSLPDEDISKVVSIRIGVDVELPICSFSSSEQSVMFRLPLNFVDRPSGHGWQDECPVSS